MSTLRLAGPDDLDKLATMVVAYHVHAGITQDEDERRAALTSLLDGVPQGAIWLIGPRSSPVGYVAVSFGWSIAIGGMSAALDEMFIREKVRGRGMGSEALAQLAQALSGQAVRALHLKIDRDDHRLMALAQRFGFASRDRDHSMTRIL